MTQVNIGLLHPGAMGISLGATAVNSGQKVWWVSENRSSDTRDRAERRGLADAGNLAKLCGICDVIISCCPPHAARTVAESVVSCNFKGVYADLNAISPQQSIQIGERVNLAGVEFVDGGIIGGPAWEKGTTWLYLSGEKADTIARCFNAGPLETQTMGVAIGKASALKMCYAAGTKGLTALYCAIVSAAENLGVRAELDAQWERDEKGSADQVHTRVRRVTAKAWRFSGEMKEIASTFESAGVPGGFHLAAHEIYDRVARFRGCEDLPDLEEVLKALAGGENK